VPALEDVALWHERDISHSSVERMIGPDATATLGFMLDRAAGLVEGLVVYPDKMRHNLDQAAELYFSEAVLLALVGAGMPRQEAYVLVQRNAMKAWKGEGRFRELLGADSDVSSRLDGKTLDRLFDLDHALAHVPAILERALGSS
jgi:adenylosuccinate lyase